MMIINLWLRSFIWRTAEGPLTSSTAKERAERTEQLKKKFPNLSVLPESNFSLRVHTMIRDKVRRRVDGPRALRSRRCLSVRQYVHRCHAGRVLQTLRAQSRIPRTTNRTFPGPTFSSTRTN
jgi:hypothetical protein